MQQAVALFLKEALARNQGRTPHVGDIGTAGGCSFSLSPVTWAGETAHCRQDALPRVMMQPRKKKSVQDPKALVSAN